MTAKKTSKPTGRKPRSAKVKEEVEAGIQTPFGDKFSSVKRSTRRTNLSVMRIISWNVRGINASDNRNRMKQLDSSHADIVLLQVTKLSQECYAKTV